MFSGATATAVEVKPLTEKDVKACQDGWAKAITTISAEYLKDGDFVGAAGKAAGELYGYGMHDPMLFKPTKATKNPFRPTGEDAMSYFGEYVCECLGGGGVCASQ